MQKNNWVDFARMTKQAGQFLQVRSGTSAIVENQIGEEENGMLLARSFNPMPRPKSISVFRMNYPAASMRGIECPTCERFRISSPPNVFIGGPDPDSPVVSTVDHRLKHA